MDDKQCLANCNRRFETFVSSEIFPHSILNNMLYTPSRIRPKLDLERNTAPATSTHTGNVNIGTVDVHRSSKQIMHIKLEEPNANAQEEHYQFAYFFRKVGQHQVLIKVSFGFAIDSRRLIPHRIDISRQSINRTIQHNRRYFHFVLSNSKQRIHTTSKDNTNRATENQNPRRPAARGKRKRKNTEEFRESEPQEEPGSQTMPRRSYRTRKATSRHLQDDADSDSPSYEEDEDFISEEVTHKDPQRFITQNQDESTIAIEHKAQRTIKKEVSEPVLSIDNVASVDNTGMHDTRGPQSQSNPADIEEQEEKPKPVLALTYQGYTISDCCLCVIVEPWPPITTPLVASNPSLRSRALSSLPLERSELSRPEEVRSKTPLFLPDWDRGKSLTPDFPSPQLSSTLISSTLDQDSSESSEMDDMMVFSQALRFVGDSFTASTYDDEVDGSVLFGDADEKKEII